MAVVFDHTAGELLLLARRLVGDAAAAEDLVQQAFVRAIERAGQFDPTRRVLPWLTAILVNEARMQRRRPALVPTRWEPREVVEPPAVVIQQEVRQVVDAAFASLPETYRDVVTLRLLHDLPPRRIAAALAVPVATVKTRLRRGVAWLRAQLPAGLALSGAVALVAGPGLAATRHAVLAQAGARGATLGLLALWGGLAMKKFASVVAALLLLAALAGVPFWWSLSLPGGGEAAARPLPVDPVALGASSGAPIASAVERERIQPPPAPPPTQSAVAGAEVAVDMQVTAVWQRSRLPARGVPVQLFVPPSTFLAEGVTDPNGSVHFALVASGHRWNEAAGTSRWVGVTTPLRPGRTYAAGKAGEPNRLLMELEDGVQVAGVVLDASGQPVVGAEVWSGVASSPSSSVARSGAGGAFVVEGLAEDFRLRAAANGRQSGEVTLRDLPVAGPLVLRLVQPLITLQVKVMSGDQPVAGAGLQIAQQVRAYDAWRATSCTDQEGLAAFPAGPEGDYRIEVVHPLHPPALRRVRLEDQDPPHLETIELGASGTLVGVVRQGERPAAGLQVLVGDAATLFHRALVTDQDGRFVVPQLAVGEHEAYFGPGMRRKQFVVRAGEQEVEFRLPGGRSLLGRLLLPDGQPAVAWAVTVRSVLGDGVEHSHTDAAGEFALAVPGGVQRVEVRGRAGGSQVFFAEPEDGQRMDFRLSAAALWRPGRILARFPGAPTGAVLKVQEQGLNSILTQPLAADGAVVVERLDPGRYRLWLTMLGEPEEFLWLGAVALASGETQDLGVQALPGHGSLEVLVRLPAGVNAPALVVALRPVGEAAGASFGPRLEPRDDGVWRCEQVPAGRWWIVVKGPGLAPALHPVAVQAGAVTHWAVDAEAAVAVLVRFDAGVEASAVGQREERVLRASDGVVVATRGVQGELQSEWHLAPGRYRFDVTTLGGYRGERAFEVPSPGPVEVVLRRP